MIAGGHPIKRDGRNAKDCDCPALLDPDASQPQPGVAEGTEPDEIEDPGFKRRTPITRERNTERQQSIDDKKASVATTIPVCAESLIRVDDVMESPKLVE
jgi:hypothetical protein